MSLPSAPNGYIILPGSIKGHRQMECKTCKKKFRFHSLGAAHQCNLTLDNFVQENSVTNQDTLYVLPNEENLMTTITKAFTELGLPNRAIENPLFIQMSYTASTIQKSDFDKMKKKMFYSMISSKLYNQTRC
jgi:hypothetical protein